ncbi:ThiF family adenylyltransferase [Bacillus sp. H-16]|uniref:ThiF family adenylyltransferase n=1 Tax=Alteribacter salitolerans TaxID=2912333 RepID=UPI0019641107|nr:ThiF family adenylyltransferase [Alteribacter salitolerans]MBM7097343.1 ThiF family adenylyltransferase [Alteribacter salitolerans]
MQNISNRYSRQELFDPIGRAGQERLADKEVFIVGMGALGSVLANHLVRAGVGSVSFADRDYVEFSNLHRQMLFDEEDAREMVPKAAAAERRLKKMNAEVNIKGYITDVTHENVLSLLHSSHIVLDGTDNLDTRFLLNDAAYKLGIPYIYGGAVSSRGMQATFIPGITPCLRCMISPSSGTGETCDTTGVLSPAVDIAASYQTVEALKILTGNEKEVRKTLLTFDIWRNHRFEMKMKQKDDCVTCTKKDYPSLTGGGGPGISTLCGRDTVQIEGREPFDLSYWAKRLEHLGEVKKTPFLVRVQLEGKITLVLFPDGRTLVQGTEEEQEAKVIYAKYIGS